MCVCVLGGHSFLRPTEMEVAITVVGVTLKVTKKS